MVSVWLYIKWKYVPSPWLLNVFVNKCIQDTCGHNKGLLGENMDVCTFLYVDSVMLLVENLHDLYEMLDILCDLEEAWKLMKIVLILYNI